MTGELPRLARTRLADTVASLFEQKILGGEWAPAFQLPSESELVEQLGVSRSVVRDAMDVLSARGLVEVRQGAGTVVTAPTSQAYGQAILVLLQRAEVTVREIAEARELIETEIAGFAALRRTDDDRELLQHAFDAYRSAVEGRNWELTKPAHSEFHLAVLAAWFMPRRSRSFRVPIQQFLLASPWPPILDDTDLWDIGLHEEILVAINSGDRERARLAIQALPLSKRSALCGCAERDLPTLRAHREYQ